MSSIRKRTSAPSNGGKAVVRYDATVTRVGARRLTKTFTTKAAAESWARKVECDIQAGTFADTSAAQQMSVQGALEIYLREVVPYLKSAPCEPPKARNLNQRLGKLPLSALSEFLADDSKLDKIYSRERHLLYVACTRARDHLLVSSTGPASEFLDDLRG